MCVAGSNQSPEWLFSHTYPSKSDQDTEFYVTPICAKKGKEHQKKRSFITFDACFGSIWMHSVPFSRVGNVGKVEV